MFKIKILALALFAAFAAALLLTDNFANPHARAFSAGPPAGYTHAPGELDCADCHTTPAQSSGTLTLNVPDNYTPGRTYDITVTHASGDATRVRWGFQMTALDAADQKAGAFAPADDLTRVVNGEGPFPAREYVEHTSAGTFPGQQNGAGWTFKWTAPAEDVGPVTFYLAGNQANGDGNSSGDNIYFTFKSATFQPAAPDFQVSVSPSSRTVVRGSNATYDVTVTPLNGFTGAVTLSASGLPAGATAGFQPASVNIDGASPQTSVLTVSTAGSTTTGPHTFNVNATSGALSHSAQAGLNVAAPTDADLAVTQSVSPNPAQAGADIRCTVNVVNNGPAAAQSVRLIVVMPDALSAFTEGANGDRCQLSSAGPNLVGYDCTLGGLAPGQGTAVDFTFRTARVGPFSTTTTVSAFEHDPFPSNNSVQLALSVAAQSPAPTMTAQGLGVRTVVSGLDQPTSMAFLGPADFLVLERATGRVVRVTNGLKSGVALDLPVNSASERGLLGIALHPNFAANRFVYLYWTESLTGQDTTAVDLTPLLGNRLDRYVLSGTTLTFDRTLLRFRALQTDAGQPARGNHNGGVLRFGPDGKLYVFVGDVGRRGFFQNLPCGPTLTCPTNPPLVQDDEFGGPEPDDAHATGAIFRLNDDGTTPSDNPYAQIPTVQGGPIVDNIRRLYAYGVRNSFGMDFDPVGGHLWTQENGDDAFDEINRVESGFNGGWAQLMGPSSRIAEFKAIEVARGNSLQQNRWPPANIADTAAEALARLYQLPGSKYTEPEFSWKYAVAPSPVGFARGAGLGPQYAGDLFVGASRTTLLGGYLMRFELSGDRKTIASTDSRLADKVADNADKFDLAESESLVVGRDFGVTTDIQTEPSKGSLYVVSLSNGAVYEVYARPSLFVAGPVGAQETPPNDSQAFGTATILLDADGQTAHVSLRFSGLTTPQTAAHLHAPAQGGQSAPPVFDLPAGNFTDFKVTLTPQQVRDLRAGLFYVNVHSEAFPAGEIRGQFGPVEFSNVVQFETAAPSVSEGAGFKTIRVERLGDTSVAAAVGYRTGDGTASERRDYTTARGVLRFAPGETVKSFDVLVTDDGLQEGDETVNLLLEDLPGGDASPSYPNDILKIVDNDAANAPANPLDDSQFFVRQHYRDFLNREPDDSGFQFWVNEIEQCGADAQCREVKRINVSAAFFLSIEFQRTGLLAYLANRAAFGNSTTAPQVPVSYSDFMRDVQALQRGYVFGAPGAEAVLEANRRAYFDEFVTRPEFVSKYGAMTNSQFVSSLLASNGLVGVVGNLYVARLDAAQQVPPNGSPATGAVIIRRPHTGAFPGENFASLYLSNLSSPVTAVHIHGPANAGAEGPLLHTLPAGEFADLQIPFTSQELFHLFGGGLYVDVHTQNNPGGEIRGQLPPTRFRVDVLTRALDEGILTRAQVFRIVAESEELRLAEFRRAFVLMQYFGYLRRDPDAEGFNFWLGKLNEFNGDYIRAEMVKAFISSIEYRQRFGL
ncbi:MAG TPA: CHRD domain-containing protein [Pyrinomonadaceae bacterium]|nr:CHRD domain-containing protein [Pyrinomonadaceae bacterium]